MYILDLLDDDDQRRIPITSEEMAYLVVRCERRGDDMEAMISVDGDLVFDGDWSDASDLDDTLLQLQRLRSN